MIYVFSAVVGCGLVDLLFPRRSSIFLAAALEFSFRGSFAFRTYVGEIFGGFICDVVRGFRRVGIFSGGLFQSGISLNSLIADEPLI